MFRYIAIVWNVRDPAQRDVASDLVRRLQFPNSKWRIVLDGHGMTVACAGERPSSRAHMLELNKGVILGTLFRRATGDDATAQPALLDLAGSSEIAATHGRVLTERYWGRYVAFLHEHATNRSSVIRDPTGGLPCLRMQHRNVGIYFSDIEDCTNLCDQQLTINWDYVGIHLAASLLQCPTTGIAEVSEVQPGECVEHCGESRSSIFYWHPAEVATRRIIESAADAAVAIRSTTRTCVHAWASQYGSILHRLSGGLDSSIVLSCLRDAPSHPTITCLNYFIQESDSDERQFARLAADRAHCKLVEHDISGSDVSVEPLLQLARSARPSSYFGYLLSCRVEAPLTGERGTSAYFDGGGGDQVFFQSRAALAACDYVRVHGIRRGLLPVALSAARLERISVWSVLRNPLIDYLLPRDWDLFSEIGKYATLVNTDVVADARQRGEFLHPWLKTSPRIPPGKLWHLFTLSFPQVFYHPLDRPDDAEPVHPLTSQPLVELCLQIPTYVLTVDGWDRSLARRAFLHDLPREIVTRRSKGGAEHYIAAVFRTNLRLIRELLLDGLLVKHGLLNRSKLEDVLSERPSGIATGLAEVFDHLSVEAWLRTWSNARQRAVA